MKQGIKIYHVILPLRSCVCCGVGVRDGCESNQQRVSFYRFVWGETLCFGNCFGYEISLVLCGCLIRKVIGYFMLDLMVVAKKGNSIYGAFAVAIV